MAFLLLFGLAACLKSKPVQRLSSPQMISVAIVHDLGSELAAVPTALASEIKGSLDARNLVMSSVSQEQYKADFSFRRATKDRIKAIEKLSAAAPLQLLVETRAEYYSQLEGRFRWTVYVKFAMAKTGDTSPPTIHSFSVPVLLRFDHQREEDALVFAAGTIARKLGQELDDFLAGLDLQTAVASNTPGAAAAAPALDSIYFVMIDRFANGDATNDGEIDLQDPAAFHGGDLRGLIDNLDHIEAMGFRTLWLSPLFAMRTEKIASHGAFHGYWTEDLKEVEQRFGTSADLLRLKQELSKRGMSLVMDMVLNHVGYETKLVTEKPSWFHGKGTIEDWNDPVQLTTYDVHGLPDLDQQNPEVYDYLLTASAQWIKDLAPIGFRLDAVKHVGSEFWGKYIREIRAQSKAPLAMIGELYNGDPAAIAKGFRNDGFSHLFDFPLYFAMNEVFCQGAHAGRLASILSLDRLYPDPSRLITFADNHDLPRVWSACGERAARVEALLTFMLSARGVPSVNYGTEVSLAGAGEPQNRSDMLFSERAPLASLIAKLLQLRRSHPLFQEGHDLPWFVDQEHYAYVRVGAQKSALVALNLGAEAWTVSHPAFAEGGVSDALSGEKIADAALTVAPGTTRIFLLGASESHAYQALVQKLAAPTQLQKVVVLAQADASDLRLVGGGPELGNWNPEAAPRGKPVGDGRFRFELRLPERATGAFKLVRINDGLAEWEDRGNRFLTATEEQQKPIEVGFGLSEETR